MIMMDALSMVHSTRLSATQQCNGLISVKLGPHNSWESFVKNVRVSVSQCTKKFLSYSLSLLGEKKNKYERSK